MRLATRSPKNRPGFTLVELMVAMALTILIMAILAGAFQVGLDTMSQLKSVAGLSGSLRSAENVILHDLSATHLEDEWGRAVQVSHPDVQKQAWTNATQKRGFFRARQVSMLKQDFNPSPTPPIPQYATDPNYPFVYEGVDPDGVPSYRATDQVLHFSSRLIGSNADQVYVGLSPSQNQPGDVGNLVGTAMNRHDLRVGPQFVSQWGEVVYYLKPNSGMATTGDNFTGGSGLTLYTLYRRVRVITPSPFNFTFAAPKDQNWLMSQYPGVSVPPSGTPTNDPLAITNVANRLNSDNPTSLIIPSTNSLGASAPEFGSDILLSNVISFQIRLQFEGRPGFDDEWQTGVNGQTARTDAAGARLYDTADDPATAGYAGGAKPRIRAIQIKLRAYDPRNKMTRQITIIQDV